MTIADIGMIGFFCMLIYMAIKGWLLLLCGAGLKERNKCWASEQYLRSSWLKNKDRRYKEYFTEQPR